MGPTTKSAVAAVAESRATFPFAATVGINLARTSHARERIVHLEKAGLESVYISSIHAKDTHARAAEANHAD